MVDSDRANQTGTGVLLKTWCLGRVLLSFSQNWQQSAGGNVPVTTANRATAERPKIIFIDPSLWGVPFVLPPSKEKRVGWATAGTRCRHVEFTPGATRQFYALS